MIEIICAVISGVFALISAIFGGITIHCYKKTTKQNLYAGDKSKNIQIGECNNGERHTKD